MKKFTKIDWDIIEARVRASSDKNGLKTKSKGLISVVLGQIFPDIQGQIHEIIVDGSDDKGVDAIHIIENDLQAEIYIFQSKHRESYKSSDRTINDNEILKIILFLNEVFDKSEMLGRCHNFRLLEAVQRIWNLHERGKFCRYRVMVCSNGGGFSLSAQNIISSFCVSQPQVSFEFYGPDTIVRGMAAEGKILEDGSLRVIGKEIYERSDGDIRGAIASIDARSFVNLIKADDGYGIKRHLFDDNLRVFLGAQGGYNSSIISTATSSDSYLFWYLNNGITITCKNFSYNKGHANPTLQFTNFQIVNGAQTSHSLVEASRIDDNNLDDVVLLVRIYATDRVDVAERVAVATNSQARIQSRDLRANHPILKKLELALLQKGYFFERKRNMAADKPDIQRIDALKLGQMILSYELREPDKAKTESDSIFDSRFEQIFNEDRDIEDLVNLIELYRHIEFLREDYLDSHSSYPDAGDISQYLVYGHWFVLFTCGVLNLRAGKIKVPFGREAEILVDEALRIISLACGQNRAIAHYQMFRSPKTKERIYSELTGRQLDFLDALLGGYRS